ncbi:DUF805 domain-containing protein [Neisseria iguanae]|nr:DUF805 domain-containing protein [Neisseria iguanae]
MHGTNRSGWWPLLNFIPLIGTPVMFIFTVLDGMPGENRFGTDPKSVERF